MKKFFAYFAVLTVLLLFGFSATACGNETPSYHGDPSDAVVGSDGSGQTSGKSDSTTETNVKSDDNELPLVPID